ncbi:MAG: radical SAM protein [Endomicrobiales bacterium]|nr:radical SAM protein [Endomicrobiales bacterium]
MKLALVFNPFSYKIHEENLRIVQKYFGMFPPLSLAWVAAIAEKAGHTVKIIDARTLRLSKEETVDQLKSFKPDVMGFMMTTYMFPETLGWIKHLKREINVPVVIGGYNLRVYPVESVMHDEIDFGVVEQAYHTVPALLRELEGSRNYENVPGLVYKKAGEIKVTPHPQKIDFNLFPFPARHLLPNDLYAEFPTERKNFSVMVTSLGCPFKCSFCEAGGTPYSPRDPKLVVDEMEECYHKYGIREIDIFDYNFTVDKKRTFEICREIKKRNLDILWACRSRVDVGLDLLYEMKEAGCGRIYYGIESGCQEILDRVHKEVTLDQIKEAVKNTKKAGIRTLGFFIIGSPDETKITVKQTLKFAKSLDLDYVQFSKCLAKPLTPLWKQMVKNTGRDYWKDWILGEAKDEPLPRAWTNLTNEEIDDLTKDAYISFHARLPFLFRSALKVRSFHEFKKKFMGFWEMIFSQESISQRDEKFQAYHGDAKRLAFYRKIAKFKA